MAPLLLHRFSLLIQLCTCLNLLLSVPLYLSVLLFVFLHRHRPPFNSSFYTLFMALGIVDLSKYLLYLAKKCSFWGWVPSPLLPPDKPNHLANLLYFALWALALAQFQLNLLLSLNRFLSVFLPRLYRRQWPLVSRCMLGLVLVSSVTLALPIRWVPVCFRSTRIELDSGANLTMLTGPVFMDQQVQADYYRLTKMFVFSMLAFCLVGYPAMFWRVHRTQMMRDRVGLVEVRMLYALALLLVANLLYAGYLIIWELLIRSSDVRFSVYAEWTLYLLIDFYDLNSPYGILLTSRLVRRSILPFPLLCQGRAESGKSLEKQKRRAEGTVKTESDQCGVIGGEREREKAGGKVPEPCR